VRERDFGRECPCSQAGYDINIEDGKPRDKKGGGSLNICCTIYRPTGFFPSNIFFLCRKNERKKERAEKRGNEGERREKEGEKDDT